MHDKTSPFEKGGLRGILLLLVVPVALVGARLKMRSYCKEFILRRDSLVTFYRMIRVIRVDVR